MNSQNTMRYLKQLADQENLTVDQVTEIVRSQFVFLREIMRSGDMEKLEFKKVLLRGLGRFTPTEGRVNKIRRRRERDESAGDK
jgi:hypothetical protein